jgi:hypothetical protein
VIVKDGAAVTKAGGAGNVPEGGDVRDERRRRVKVFGEMRILFSEDAKRDSEGAKAARMLYRVRERYYWPGNDI